MRFYRFLSAVLTLCLAGMLTAYAEVAPPKNLYAFMNNASSWTEGFNFEPYWGFYSFSPNGKGGFTAISPTGFDYDWALTTEGGGGGVYEDGYYYCYSATGSWSNYRVTYSKVNTRTWKTEFKTSFSGTNSNPVLVPDDLTIDPISGKMYAVCSPKLMNGDYSTLVEVNRETGELTPLFTMTHIGCIASDANGQLYALSTPGERSFGTLYKVNLDSKSLDAIGSTGLNYSGKNTSATIDFRSGKMYHTFYGHPVSNGNIDFNSSLQALYEINLQTGEATLCHVYDDYQDLSALSAPNAHPSAPDILADLTFLPTGVEELNGVVKFTAPSLTYGQQPLSGAIDVTIILDGNRTFNETATAGQVFTKQIELDAPGVHSVAVTLTANNHTGEPDSASSFFGTDTPDHISNLLLSASADQLVATLTWDAPTGSLNGGAYDPEKVRYQIVRFPGNVTVARSHKGTTFTENIPHSYAATYYKVTPYIEGHTDKKGETSTSNKIGMGAAWTFPYIEPFNIGSWDYYTVIDANGDGGDWEWEDPVWKYDDQLYCAFFYHFYQAGPADDWFITPKLAFDPAKLYRITFQAYGYYTTRSNDFEVACGNALSAEGMHTVLGHVNLQGTGVSNPSTISYRFAPKEGDAYIGFHNVTVEPNHLSIDNILIEEIGLSTVPGEVTALAAEIIDRSAGKVSLTFDAPLNDAGGVALKGNMNINIYRGTDTAPIKTISNVKPGQHIEFTDDKASPAINTYTVTGSNADGEGLSVQISVDLRAGKPQPVTSVQAQLINPNQVALTWTPSNALQDEEGNDIDTESIRYNVYRPGIYGGYDVIGRSLSECQFIDNDPRFVSGGVQSALIYYVSVVNGDGESNETASNIIYIGDSYTLPFEETWFQQIPATNPWLRSNTPSAEWTYAYQGYDPLTPGQDGPGLLSLELAMDGEGNMFEQGEGILWSPRIDLSNVKDATLSFYLYGHNTYKEADNITLYVDIEGVGQGPISGASFSPRKFAGWKECKVDLTPYVGNDRVAIILVGTITNIGGDGHRIHIDNLRITGNPVDKEVRISAINGPGEVRAELPSTYKVQVENLGTSDCENLPIAFYADDELIETKTIDYINAGEKLTVEFEYTPAGASDDAIELLFEIKPATGTDVMARNNEMSMNVKVLPLNLPYITDLNGIYYSDRGEATLMWSYPNEAEEFETILDSAEGYDAFAINDFGCWSVYDGDGAVPFQFSDPDLNQRLTWDNYDQPQAWMVFKPSDVTSQRTFYPYTGDQVFVSFGAASRGGNNDWLISPELSGEPQLISFLIRHLNEEDTDETYNVLYSTTDTDPASFKRINGDKPLYASYNWEVKHFALPAGAKYFAIQYVGVTQSAIMIDDMQFEAYPTHVRPDGYRIYRDGQPVNNSLTSRRNFTDTNVPAGVYTYEVRPVYNGVEALGGKQFILDTSGVSAPDATETASVMTSQGYIHVMNGQGKNVTVVSIDGKVLASHAVKVNREAIPMAAGIYVVNIDGRNFKVIVR